MTSVTFGLLSAIFWGSGDFWGGVVSRKIGAYRAVFYAEIVGLAMLFTGIAVTGEAFPEKGKFLLALLAGAIGTGGLIILYRAMATGLMSIATPISALLAAALPVAIGLFFDGLPKITALIGFFLAFVAVWFISQDSSEKLNLQKINDLFLPLFAGLCFGTYFVLIHSASDTTVIWPMVASRTGGMAVVVVAMIYTKTPWKLTEERPWKLIILNAFLDIFGNAFFIIAGQYGRLDIASILGSMYPGATVLLAWYYLKEKLNGLQWAGILSALVAIVLLTV
jgi:drug/metabolite transporter (DMT)-like permease